MEIKKNYLKFILFSFLLVAWYPLFELFYVLPQIPPVSQGPSSKTIQTTGIFKPGGYIRFDFEPGIKSIEGYFKAAFRIRPLLSDSLREKGIEWPSFQGEKDENWPWGEKVATNEGPKNIEFHVYVDIPKNNFLLDKNIPLIITTKIIYPRKIKGHKSFKNGRKEMNERIEIEISNDNTSSPKISNWRGFWLRKKSTTYEVILGFIWLLGFIGIIFLYYYLIDETK